MLPLRSIHPKFLEQSDEKALSINNINIHSLIYGVCDYPDAGSQTSEESQNSSVLRTRHSAEGTTLLHANTLSVPSHQDFNRTTPTPAEATTVSTESAETQLLEIYSLYNYEMVLKGNMSKRLGESVCLTLPCFNQMGWLSNTGTCHFQIWEAEGCTRMYTHHKHLLTCLTNQQITVKHT